MKRKNKNRCARCNKKLTTKAYSLSERKPYHILPTKHFKDKGGIEIYCAQCCSVLHKIINHFEQRTKNGKLTIILYETLNDRFKNGEDFGFILRR